MTAAHPWFLAAIAGVLLVFHLELAALLLNLARLGKPLPPDLAEVYPEETRERLTEYAIESARQRFVHDAVDLAVLLGFWWGGGFGWMQRMIEHWGHGPVWTGVAAIGVGVVAQMLLSLPFEIWHTFGLEAKFGFNRTTPATFIADHLKSLVLLAILGLPLAALVVWLFETQPLAALYGWLCVAGFNVLMNWLAPRLIFPLFLQFRPLEEGALRTAIFALADRLQFPVREVSIVDGSRRSTKANAFFAGFGKTRRIALYDTLLDGHEPDEIVAILAHEIGHNKRRHVPLHLVISALELGIVFAVLHWMLQSPGFFAAFGVAGTPVGLGMLLFAVIYRPLGVLIGAAGLAVSRKNEFEADAFAADAMGGARALVSGLKKLSREHLSHPQPHPLMVALHYSHPPLSERVAALGK